MSRVLYSATVKKEHMHHPCLPLPPLWLVRPFGGVAAGLRGKKKKKKKKVDYFKKPSVNTRSFGAPQRFMKCAKCFIFHFYFVVVEEK